MKNGFLLGAQINLIFYFKLYYDIHINIMVILISKSKKNELRGIHKSPYEKRVTVISGSVTDYIIDFSKKDISYKKYELNSKNNNQIIIPENHGHLFISNSDNTILRYELCGLYDSNLDETINYLDPKVNLDIDSSKNYILSEKDKTAKFYHNPEYILMGSNGFLGSSMAIYLDKLNKNYIELNIRLHNYDLIKYYFEKYKPKYIICAAGISGKPTIKWCEDNKEITFKTNVIDTLKLCEITNNLNIHLTLFGSGSIYNGGFNSYGEQIMSEFSEETKFNRNNDKYYLKCRNILEDSIDIYKNVLCLRIQYPIALNKDPRCFMSKLLTRTNSIHDQYVNITFVPNLFP